ncbi:hypothetical protein JW898_05580 [Candidatus Woesearchaeota archaeon]|nr:hypothetical protein [Candidatus Woesearchaeota archaeon]
MKQFKLAIAMVILVSAIVILLLMLFTPQPIQITLESGREITTESLEYYTLTKVLLLVSSAFLIGAMSVYLFYNADIRNGLLPVSGRSASRAAYSAVLNLLKVDEKRAFLAVVDSGGEMLQNRLVSKLGLSKVKVTRILAGLERKNLIVKERHGLTNKVKLKEIGA